MNRTVIFAKSLITSNRIVSDASACIEDKFIRELGSREQAQSWLTNAQVFDFRQHTVVPGFIDLHVHGGSGRDFMEGSREAVVTVSSHLARHGTTSFLATTVTASPISTIKAVENLSKMVETELTGAKMIGLHLEGPFISGKKGGVHPRAFIRQPSTRIFGELYRMSGGAIKLITLAPELEGALDFIRDARSKGVAVSVGHSNATYGEALRAIEAGASQATHTFNAMRDFNHREPGILGAVLTDERIWAEVIADGVHVHPAAIDVLLRCKGAGRTLLITDAISAAGMPDGEYQLGDFTVKVVEGVCRNTEGNLAGSTLTQDLALRNVLKWTGVSLQEAVNMATLNPARAIGIDHQAGTLEPGRQADLVVLDEDLEVQATLCEGRWVYWNPSVEGCRK